MTEQLDLFGEPVTEPWPAPAYVTVKPKRKGKTTRPAGYARRPGTGPAGETCRTCAYRTVILGYGNRFYKCTCNFPNWTHGRKSDILLKSPACVLWSQGYEPENAPFIDRLKD